MASVLTRELSRQSSPAQLMDSSLAPPAQWAQSEFALAQLGDQRRTRRLVKIATRLAENPGGTLPQAFCEWRELKAAYRFFDQPRVSFEQIQSVHRERTRAKCYEPGEYLLIEDTTQLHYHRNDWIEGMGTIGDGRAQGLHLHSTLAVRVEAWDLEQRPEGVVVGLLGQQCLSRSNCPERKRENWLHRLQRSRESQRWGMVFDDLRIPAGRCHWIYIADREADIYELMESCLRRELDFIIRGYRDRLLADREHCLTGAAAQLPMRGTMEVELRSRPGQAARRARVEVRSGSLRLRGVNRLGGRRPDWEVNVIEVREIQAPAGAEPLHWILLTSLPCDRWAELRRIIGRYAARWWVEEYHKALKTGAQVEASQMERGYRIENLIAVLAIVAIRLLNTKHLARARPNQPVDREAFGAGALSLLAAKFGQPPNGWTHQTALVAVARMGGFIGRRGDGQPGWQTIWRGWHRLMRMCDGLDTLISEGKRCG